LRMLAPLTRANTTEKPQMLGGRTRAALEREKTLVLRSLKELEFDRAMRKLSDKDFSEMTARLRLRAARILRQLDAGSGYRQDIEKEIERRLRAKGIVVPEVAPDAPPEHKAAGGAADVSAPEQPAAIACAACGTQNDADARFCKECGASLGVTA
jgi:hypothetical protein